MKYEVLYLPVAQRDLIRLSDAFSGQPGKARRLLGEIESKARLLEYMPRMWPPFGSKPEFLQMDVEDHILLYIVDEEKRKVKVFRVLPSKQEAGELRSSKVVDIGAVKYLSIREPTEAEGE